MKVHRDFTVVGRLLANQARAAMVDELLDGGALSASALARLAAVSPSTASAHLGALVEGGLLSVREQGRHRYYALAGGEVAAALRQLSRISPIAPVLPLRVSRQAQALRFARTCYDHLAGLVGVALLDALLAREWLSAASAGYLLSGDAEMALGELGIRVDALRRQRRSFARPCLDWSERRPHLAGALGAALTTALLDRRWVQRDAVGREVRLTPAGQVGLHEVFGLSMN